MPNQTEIKIYSFKALSNLALYSALKLRSDVFVVEQTCVYPDLDDKDIRPDSLHVIAFEKNDEDNKVIAYARCLAPGVSYPGASIGRVAVDRQHRGKGLAQQLMHTAISTCQQTWPNFPIQIGAQTYLSSFYRSLGFIPFSEPYDEDGIQHIDMQLA
jgi:ElaA protein